MIPLSIFIHNRRTVIMVLMGYIKSKIIHFRGWEPKAVLVVAPIMNVSGHMRSVSHKIFDIAVRSETRPCATPHHHLWAGRDPHVPLPSVNATDEQFHMSILYQCIARRVSEICHMLCAMRSSNILHWTYGLFVVSF